MTATSSAAIHAANRSGHLLDDLNGVWHKQALWIFMAIVLAHWSEHLAQAFQIYVLGWPIPDSRGVLGQFFPWVVTSEVLHYGYALVMLIGLWIFRRGFVGRERVWWMIAFWIQFWHHVEHLALQTQAIIGQNLLGRPVPTSFAQIWIPRVELHLLYNTLVFIPMVVAMYHHMFPTPQEEARHVCTCAAHARALPA